MESQRKWKSDVTPSLSASTEVRTIDPQEETFFQRHGETAKTHTILEKLVSTITGQKVKPNLIAQEVRQEHPFRRKWTKVPGLHLIANSILRACL